MIISPADEELIRKCTVQIIVSEQKKGLGFFVAPNKLLTCKHVVSNYESIELDWSGRKLSAHVEKRCKDADIALFSVKLADHPYLPLNDDLVSFEVLYVPGHATLTVQGFAGNAEVIILQVDRNDFEGGASGTPLFNPRTGGICGLISGGKKETKTVHATYIKNALKSFPELEKMQNNVQKLPSNITKIFMIHAQADEELLNEVIQLLHDANLTASVALYWKTDLFEDHFWIEEAEWSSYPPTFDTANIVLLLVNSNFHDNSTYYKDYVQQAWQRHQSGKARFIQVLSSNASPVPDWPQESMTYGEFTRGIREIIETLNNSNP